MLWAAFIATTFALIPPAQAQSYDYLGWFAGTVEVRAFPMSGYYYSPNTPLPPKVLDRTVLVRVKVLDGGSICPTLTRYKTYLYSPTPLPGYYLLPPSRVGLNSAPPVGWPLVPASSLGWQIRRW